MNKNQPKGLYLLSFTEIWERFGFYTVSTILVLYLSKGLGLSDEDSYLLYGAFSSMLYLMPVLGGYIADRFIGLNQSIALGAILLTVGYALMSIPSAHFLLLGLSVVILGHGFFKPNVSSMVGHLYPAHDPRREGGFTIFYMGINIGSLFPPLFAGALVAAHTWGSGFVVAATGTFLALITFLVGKKTLQGIGGIPSISPLHKKKVWKRGFYLLLLMGLVGMCYLLHWLLTFPKISNWILAASSILITATVLFYLLKELPEQRRKMVACLILTLISVGFWSIYNQTFTSLMLFADRNMSKELLGFTIDAEFTQFFNPFFIILLSPFFNWGWTYLDNREKNPSIPFKFSLGILLMAIGFFVLGAGVLLFHQQGQASPWWLIFSYFIQTCGELLLSPIGLAMVTRLSPKHLIGMMMGVWFLTQSAAFAIGGGLATFSDVPNDLSSEASLLIYSKAFFIYGGIALFLALISFSLTPYLKRLIGSVNIQVQTPKY